MKISLEDGLAYVATTIHHRGRSLELSRSVLDTGSATTLIAADRAWEIDIVPEAYDEIVEIRGVGGTEFVVAKRIDQLDVGELSLLDFTIEIEAMEYGVEMDAIIGLDFLLQAGAVIDLAGLELYAA